MTKPFVMSDFIRGIKGTTSTVDIYPDLSDAEEILSLREEYDNYLRGGETPLLAVGEETPKQQYESRITEIRKRGMTLTMRALSNKELEVTKQKVVREFKIDKNLPEDLRLQLESERTERLYVELIARAITKVENHADDSLATALSVDDLTELRAWLPSFMWDEVKMCWDKAQSLGAALLTEVSDPSFRGDESGDQGEQLVSLTSENSAPEEPAAEPVPAGVGDMDEIGTDN